MENIFFPTKEPWTRYLKENPCEAKRINKITKRKFNCKSFIDEDKKILSKQSDIVYNKIYDYLEIEGKDEKIKILFSQYGFFRDSQSLWFCTSIILLILIALHFIGLISLKHHSYYYIISFFISAFLFLTSKQLMKQRKLLFMTYVYRNFIANNVKK